MAKLSAHGTEVFRCFDPHRRILKAYMSDGTILARSLFSGWSRYGKIKEGRTVEEVVDNIMARVSQALLEGKGNYGWIFKVDHLPSVKSLERWANADLVPTPTGYEVEPDG